MELNFVLVVVSSCTTLLCLMADCCSAIECIVRTRKDVNNTYEIRWIMKNTTGEVNYLTPNNTTCQYTDAFKICTRRYNIHNQRYNPSFLGKYWCQVINTTADPDQHLMRSNVFTLLPPDKYSEPTCTVVQYKEKTTCANLTDQSKSSPLPFSTTTMDISRPHLTSELHIAVDVTTSPPTTRKPVSTVYIAAGVSGGVLVLLALIITSTLIVMLIVMKKRKIQAKTTENFNSYWVNKNNIEYCESDANASSQPVIYAVPDQTREVNTNKEKDSSNGEYHYLGDVATGAAMFDDRTYDDVGASNSLYLHLEDAVTIGVDTEYSKLSHDGNYKQDVHVPHSRNDHDSNRPASHDMQEYSSLNHHPPPPTIDSNYHKLSHKDTTLQQYSSLQHHTMSHTTNSDNTVTSDQQQYSVLNNI